MSMMTDANRLIGMVKQSPFQEDLFDFSYIENQVNKIKENMEKSKDKVSDPSLEEMLNQQLFLLHDIQSLLYDMRDPSKKKKRWFNFK